MELPPLAPPALPDRERFQHLWLQVPDGPDWIDCDPSLPDAAAEPLVVTETWDALPDDWYHRLRIAIEAEEFYGGTLARREAVSFATTSDKLVDVPVALSMASADELSDLGLGITEFIEGQKAVFPTIYVDGQTMDSSQPLVFTTDAETIQDVLSAAPDATIQEGESVAVWLVIEIASPDAAPVLTERALLDRIPAEDRTNVLVNGDPIDTARIAPLEIVPTSIGSDTLAQFSGVTVIHTDVARIPSTDAFFRYVNDDLFGALGLLGPAMAGFRDQLGTRIEADAGAWSYPSAPNVTVFHVFSGTPGAGEGRATVVADLVHRARTSLPLAEAAVDNGSHPLVRSGVLNAVAEQVMLAPETRGETEDTSAFATSPAISAIFAAAAGSGVQIRLLRSVDDLSGIEADAASHRYLTAALETGLVAIVPASPVEIDGAPVLGWWIVDPLTGHTRDQLQNGMSGASTSTLASRPVALHQTAGEYSFLTRAVMWIANNAGTIYCLGMGAAAAGLYTAALLKGLSGSSAGRMAAAGGFASAGGAAALLGACA